MLFLNFTPDLMILIGIILDSEKSKCEIGQKKKILWDFGISTWFWMLWFQKSHPPKMPEFVSIIPVVK